MILLIRKHVRVVPSGARTPTEASCLLHRRLHVTDCAGTRAGASAPMAPPAADDGEAELAKFIYSVVDKLPQADAPQVCAAERCHD